MDIMTLYWLVFIAIFCIVYSIDLYVTEHRKETISIKSSLGWTAIWISVAMLFGISLYFFFPQNPDSPIKTGPLMMVKFISGYFTEYSLSVDNLFVFIMIFSMMGINEKNQPKLLKMGIMISVVLRILFILVGMELVQHFHWIIYIFGFILIWTAYKMAASKGNDNIDPQSNILYKGASKIFPVDPDVHSPYFFTKIDGKTHITNLFLALLVIGSTDILFAVDSIPAIIGVIKEGSTNILTPSEENFLAISSNVFAVMGLISLFFALKGIMGMFRFLKTGVSFILFFIGAKMLLGAIPTVEHFFVNHSWISLAVIIGTLLLSIVLSVLIKNEKATPEIEQKDSH
ncbi:TerC/Alx family metal homeostasis membrane protein [Anaerorudis cellulosivorans]|uniref:TerC/Alx family metal homeostasis membrane protein n=1 Tax=Anaerorudis cellulosivorans TaxID=3397862 RepID=UPI0022200CEC|nr:TerC/Alx family metal homeostasis membrane protein [Seramator thermalis]MCW1735806.1 TerC/Alx family metal homeostasis membrane protein [Seramator thermalis]